MICRAPPPRPWHRQNSRRSMGGFCKGGLSPVSIFQLDRGNRGYSELLCSAQGTHLADNGWLRCPFGQGTLMGDFAWSLRMYLSGQSTPKWDSLIDTCRISLTSYAWRVLLSSPHVYIEHPSPGISSTSRLWDHVAC